jgi:tellurium resistance protein TerD
VDNMGINLGGNAPVLNLQKNEILDLTKRNPGLKSVTLGAGWDISYGGVDFDIDIAAFMLDANNKVNTVSNVAKYPSNFKYSILKLLFLN